MGNKIASVGTALVGGVTLSPSQFTVYANGHIVLRDMDLTLPHMLHQPNPVPSTSANVYVCGRRILRLNDIATCGHNVTVCEPTIFSS